MDKLIGLEYGADDYVTKPFDIREVILRVKSILRRIERTRGGESEGGTLRVADTVVDLGRHEVYKGERRVELTPKEFALLEILMRSPGRVFTRSELLERSGNLNIWEIRGRSISISSASGKNCRTTALSARFSAWDIKWQRKKPSENWPCQKNAAVVCGNHPSGLPAAAIRRVGGVIGSNNEKSIRQNLLEYRNSCETYVARALLSQSRPANEGRISDFCPAERRGSADDFWPGSEMYSPGGELVYSSVHEMWMRLPRICNMLWKGKTHFRL